MSQGDQQWRCSILRTTGRHIFRTNEKYISRSAKNGGVANERNPSPSRVAVLRSGADGMVSSEDGADRDAEAMHLTFRETTWTNTKSLWRQDR